MHMFLEGNLVRLCEAGYYPWFIVILVKEYTLVLLGARSHFVAQTYVFVSSDSNCLAHNSDFGLLSVTPQSLVSLSDGMHWVLRDELGLGAF
ncbi:hypothetical protein L6452_24199 [Arctium lappa]|uniref:Uncharacterized protein n=1 Tax=Arctium lappa TaxID=4217 RepID=A0ACB9ADD3_ARCLA|nr:hypothetical protein L6452_24199 [Arctium lappa]